MWISIRRLSQFDLHLIASDRYGETGAPQGISGVFTYATDLFDEATVQCFVDRFVRVLDVVVTDPSVCVGDVDLLDAAERDRILDGWNATGYLVDAVCDAGLAARADVSAPAARRWRWSARTEAGWVLCRARCAGESFGAASDLAGCGSGVAGGVGFRSGRWIWWWPCMR